MSAELERLLLADLRLGFMPDAPEQDTIDKLEKLLRDERERREEVGRQLTHELEWREAALAREKGLRELAGRAKSQAAAPDYDEEAIRDALWALVDAALTAQPEEGARQT